MLILLIWTVIPPHKAHLVLIQTVLLSSYPPSRRLCYPLFSSSPPSRRLWSVSESNIDDSPASNEPSTQDCKRSFPHAHTLNLDCHSSNRGSKKEDMLSWDNGNVCACLVSKPPFFFLTVGMQNLDIWYAYRSKIAKPWLQFESLSFEQACISESRGSGKKLPVIRVFTRKLELLVKAVKLN